MSNISTGKVLLDMQAFAPARVIEAAITAARSTSNRTSCPMSSNASATRQHRGLGLAIVKPLVEQQRGTVRASGAGANCGASFTLQLPLAATAPGSVPVGK